MNYNFIINHKSEFRPGIGSILIFIQFLLLKDLIHHAGMEPFVLMAVMSTWPSQGIVYPAQS